MRGGMPSSGVDMLALLRLPSSAPSCASAFIASPPPVVTVPSLVTVIANAARSGAASDRGVAAMRARHGADAEQILIEGAPHVMIFPNLFIAEIQVFNIQPVSVNECTQYSTAVQLAGAPELNRRMVSQCVGSVGPAGMLLADDTEMYERNQQGLAALTPEWLDVRRGIHRETVDENGHPVGTATDETGMRGFWSHYKNLMETP